MLIFADIKSKKYKALEEIGDAPIIGTIFILLFSILPGIILFFFDLPKEYETPLFYYISSIWCFVLDKLEIYIKLFFIPAWILFFVLGVIIGYTNYIG
jgi:hypothetical protein